jgi:hypothetical protein
MIAGGKRRLATRAAFEPTFSPNRLNGCVDQLTVSSDRARVATRFGAIGKWSQSYTAFTGVRTL